MDSEVQQLVNGCREACGGDLIGILFLGSTARDDDTDFSDIDLAVVVETCSGAMLAGIRDACLKCKLKLDLYVFAADEISLDIDALTMGSNGCYYWHTSLRHAYCLWGSNPFVHWPGPSKQQLYRSVLEKVTQYTYWSRHLVIASSSLCLADSHKLNVRLVKAMMDCLFLQGRCGLDLTKQATVALFTESNGRLLSDKDRGVIHGWHEPERWRADSVDTGLDHLLERVNLMSTIYKLAIAAYNEAF